MSHSTTVDIFVLEHNEHITKDLLLDLHNWSEHDHDQIERFVDVNALTSWCISRMLSRQIIAEYTGNSPESIEFQFGEFGKPFLPASCINFNWAHTNGCVVLGVSFSAEIGVDIERLNNTTVKPRDIALSFFKPEEYKWVSGGNQTEEHIRFLSLFVQKEAFLKMQGCGLSSPLSDAPAFLALPFHQTNGFILSYIGDKQNFILCARISENRGEINISSSSLFNFHNCRLNLSNGNITHEAFTIKN